MEINGCKGRKQKENGTEEETKWMMIMDEYRCKRKANYIRRKMKVGNEEKAIMTYKHEKEWWKDIKMRWQSMSKKIWSMDNYKGSVR